MLKDDREETGEEIDVGVAGTETPARGRGGDEEEVETWFQEAVLGSEVPVNIQAFLRKIGVKPRDIPFLTQGGLTEVDDLVVIDNEAVVAFEITPISKSILRNYIIWRNDTIRSYAELSDYVNVTKEGLLRARRRRDQADANSVSQTKEGIYDRTLIESFKQQSDLIDQQSTVMK
ncbi:MAG: hypothetical protein ACRDL7_05405, partial [Gaiellaceae bacterium]